MPTRRLSRYHVVNRLVCGYLKERENVKKKRKAKVVIRLCRRRGKFSGQFAKFMSFRERLDVETEK